MPVIKNTTVKLKYNKTVIIPEDSQPQDIAKLTGLDLESSVYIFEQMIEKGCAEEITFVCGSGSGGAGINIEEI